MSNIVTPEKLAIINDHVLVRGGSPFSYYGQRWDGTWTLCKDQENATPIRRAVAAELIAKYADSCAYMEPLSHAQRMHLANVWPLT